MTFLRTFAANSRGKLIVITKSVPKNIKQEEEKMENLQFIKPWPKASQRNFYSCVQLGLSSDNFGWTRTQVNARFLSFGHPRKVDTSWSQVIYVCVKLGTFCDLRELASRLANPFVHPSLVNPQFLVLHTYFDLHGLASLFGQGQILFLNFHTFFLLIQYYSSEGIWFSVNSRASSAPM